MVASVDVRREVDAAETTVGPVHVPVLDGYPMRLPMGLRRAQGCRFGAGCLLTPQAPDRMESLKQTELAVEVRLLVPSLVIVAGVANTRPSTATDSGGRTFQPWLRHTVCGSGGTNESASREAWAREDVLVPALVGKGRTGYDTAITASHL